MFCSASPSDHGLNGVGVIVLRTFCPPGPTPILPRALSPGQGNTSKKKNIRIGDHQNYGLICANSRSTRTEGIVAG